MFSSAGDLLAGDLLDGDLLDGDLLDGDLLDGDLLDGDLLDGDRHFAESDGLALPLIVYPVSGTVAR